MTSEKFLEKSGAAISTAHKNLEELLIFAQEMLSKTTIGKYAKAKTITRFNAFSAMYQRAAAVLALGKVKQGYVANVIIRSMWETLVTYDFVNLQRGNLNIEVLLGLESNQLARNWRHIKQLRKDYPLSNTWQTRVSDTEVDRRITSKQSEVDRYNVKHSSLPLKHYDTLLKRLQKIDSTNIRNNANHQTLTQFDYRTVYWLLSGDAHSTILGNLENSRIHKKSHVEIRLESGNMLTLRALQVAFTLLLNFLRSFNSTFRLGLGAELKKFSKIDTQHDRAYSEIESELN